MRWIHPIYPQKSPAKIKTQYVEKTASTVFSIRPHQTTARGSADYPRVRHSVQKSPKGAAGIAQQVRKIEVFSKRLSVQKSPKGAAGPSVQKSPTGAAGLTQ
jgi:hypothetical protein